MSEIIPTSQVTLNITSVQVAIIMDIKQLNKFSCEGQSEQMYSNGYLQVHSLNYIV